MMTWKKQSSLAGKIMFYSWCFGAFVVLPVMTWIMFGTDHPPRHMWIAALLGFPTVAMFLVGCAIGMHALSRD